MNKQDLIYCFRIVNEYIDWANTNMGVDKKWFDRIKKAQTILKKEIAKRNKKSVRVRKHTSHRVYKRCILPSYAQVLKQVGQ